MVSVGLARSRSNASELWTWLALAIVTAAVLPPPATATTAVVLILLIALGWVNPRLPFERPVVSLGAALVAFPLFFALRTNLLNADGTMLTPKFERDVPLMGAYLSHDELLEFFVHSRFWYYTNKWWGWSVVFSYQVASCAAGCLFVYALVRLSRRLAAERTWLFLTGVLSGAYMQLFFGDVENYTITAALVTVYVLLACRFLAREVPLWIPLLTLAVATAFHLEAGWLLPSALFLCLVSRSRTGALRDALKAALIGGAVVPLVFLYFNFHGLPLLRFASSHAGNALRLKNVFAIGMPRGYYADQLQLFLWLCPTALMIVPSVIWRTRPVDEVATFLAISAGSMMLLQAIWKSQIGVFEDWNLYAIGGMLTMMCIWRYMAVAAITRPMRIAGAALAAVGSLHTYAWILANHRSGH
jgi:hypothetical protein